MAESGPGKIYLFDDFCGPEYPIAHTGAYAADTFTGQFIGPYRVLGDLAETDTGVVSLGIVSGAVRISGNDEDGKGVALATDLNFSPGLMGTLVVEARVQLATLTTRNIFVGFCGTIADDVAPPLTSATTTHTLTAADLCGIHMDSGLTAGTTYHAVFNGGTVSGETNSDNTITAKLPVAAEWDVLRVEIDTNGTARFIINGDVEATVVNAVSTTVIQGALVGCWGTTATAADMDVDYMMVKANRDWTR